MEIKAHFIYEDDVRREEVCQEIFTPGTHEDRITNRVVFSSEFQESCTQMANWIYAVARRFDLTDGGSLTRVEVTDGRIEIANFQSNSPTESADWIDRRKWLVEVEE